MNRAQRRRSRHRDDAGVDEARPAFSAGVAAFQHGDLDAAERHFRLCLAAGPEGAPARFNLGIIAARRGSHEAAVPLFREAVALRPAYTEAWLNLGLSLFELKRFDEARGAAARAVELDPDRAVHWAALAQVSMALSDVEGAERACRRALAVDPAFIPALYRLLDLLSLKNDTQGYLDCCDEILTLAPTSADIHLARGHALQKLGRETEAKVSFQAVLHLDVDGKGPALTVISILAEAGRSDEAITAFDRIIALNPRHGSALTRRALVHQRAGRFQQALEDLKLAMEVTPQDERVHQHLGHLFLEAEQPKAAVEFFLQAIRLKPDFTDAVVALAGAHTQLEDYETAQGALEYALTIAPGRVDLRVELCWSQMMACNWQPLSETLARIIKDCISSGCVITPFKVMGLGLSNLETLLWTRAWSEQYSPVRPQPVDRLQRSHGARIRVGYVSADFRNHATAFLITELFELHDRTRFEITGYNIGRIDDSSIGRRMIAALDHFVDLSGLRDREAAQRIADDGIDVLIDLKGYTRESRAAIFTYRPAPIQVNYLGFPSTMGTRDIDYVIADELIAPEDHQPCYDERIVRLPNSYQPNVRRSRAHPNALRIAQGLPEEGFIFCCFNNSYKITPLIFDVWMRLLKSVPHSVLWMFQANPQARDNLCREAKLRGVEPSRLVFAPRVANAEHLGRSGLADLFLDTLPINAHTTASDALWAGVPVLTCLGPYFFGRVAASLLHAVGLPDLVTQDLAAYEALALALARDPARLAGLRARLAANRDTAPLFDTPRYARNYEAALTRMVELHDAGRAPEPFTIEEGGPDGSGARAPTASLILGQ